MTEVHFDGPCEVGSPEWERRLFVFMTDPNPRSWWWLSFVDTDKSAPLEEQVPGGGGFLGVCIVPASNIVQAAQIAHMLDCNPGGQVAGYPACPEGWHPKPEFIGKLFADDYGRAMGNLELDEYAEPDE